MLTIHIPFKRNVSGRFTTVNEDDPQYDILYHNS